jgi:hypothetical protein
MHVDGRCHCGAIAFTAEVDPERASICHCTDCQRFASAPYRASIPAAAADFRLLSGRPKAYVKTADSGAKRVQAFCETCGTPIYSSAVEAPPVFNLRLGTLEQRAEIAPRRQIWCESALAWAADIAGLPASARG